MCRGNSPLGQALFQDFFKSGKCSKKSSSSKNILTKDQFVAGSQKVVQLIGDEQLLTYYVQVHINFKDRGNSTLIISNKYNRYFPMRRTC